MGFFNKHETPETPKPTGIDNETQTPKSIDDDTNALIKDEDDGLGHLRKSIQDIEELQVKIDEQNAQRAAKIKAALNSIPKDEKPEEGNTNWITNEIKGIVESINEESTGVMDKLSKIKDIINQAKSVDTGPSVLAKAKIGLLVEALKTSATSSLDEKINEVKGIPGVDVDKKGPGSGINLELQSVMASKLIDDLEKMKAEIEKM